MHLPPLSKRAARIVTALGLLLILVLAAIRLSMQAPPVPERVAQPVAVPPPVSPPQLDAKSTTILELFNPSDAALTRQLNETELAQRIERIFVSSFVLVRCDLMTQNEYRETFHHLLTYAEQAGLASDAAAVETRVRVIAESASASYAFVYSRVNCDDPKLRVIAKQLNDWRTIDAR